MVTQRFIQQVDGLSTDAFYTKLNSSTFKDLRLPITRNKTIFPHFQGLDREKTVQIYTVFQKKVHPYYFRDNNVK